MSISRRPQLRHIAPFGIATPLLVPSFSSRGFVELKEMVNALRVDVRASCLVSAFDLAKGYAPADFETFADVVFIDSGVYETATAAVAVDVYLPEASNGIWTRTDYRDFLASAAARMQMTNTVVVSYDTYKPLDEQIEQAGVDFKASPTAAHNFLVKPETPANLYGAWTALTSHLEQFQIIGVTEHELGNSALERCRSLIRLRDALTTLGLDLPIHVFGAITPAAITAYFLCGADIFDGLNWLRVGLSGAGESNLSEFTVTHRLYAAKDEAVWLELARRNLRTLQSTQNALQEFTRVPDLQRLQATLPFTDMSIALATAAAQAEGKPL